jgi:ATP-dependent DNA ligase
MAVLFSASIGAPAVRTGRRAAQRVLQALVGLVHAHRPLHGDALGRVALGGEAVGVHLGLQRAPAAVEFAAVQRVPARQAEEGEVVVVELHGRSRCRGTRRPQTRNDSPQPQRSFSRGLLNLKPSFRPSRTKSSSVPSR